MVTALSKLQPAQPGTTGIQYIDIRMFVTTGMLVWEKKPSKCRQSNILETTNQILKGFVTRLSFSYLLPPVNHFQHRNGPNIVKSSVILEHHHHILVSAEHPEAPLGSCPHGVDCPKPPRFRQPLLQQRHTAKRSLPSPGGIKEVLIESQRILNIYINISYIYIYVI